MLRKFELGFCSFHVGRIWHVQIWPLPEYSIFGSKWLLSSLKSCRKDFHQLFCPSTNWFEPVSSASVNDFHYHKFARFIQGLQPVSEVVKKCFKMQKIVIFAINWYFDIVVTLLINNRLFFCNLNAFYQFCNIIFRILKQVPT